MATIVDVARVAGVSISTVSHVVNGTRSVRDATRDRVLQAIEDTAYRQDGVARALRRSRTDSVGLVLTDVSQPVFAEMVRGVEEVASGRGYTLLLANSAEQVDRELRSVAALSERRVDGLLVAPVAGSTVDAVRGAAPGMPVVIIDRLGPDSIDQVGIENHGPMKALVKHLAGHGHRRVAYAAGDLRVPTMAERFRGYRDALIGLGVPVDDALVVTGSGLFTDTRQSVTELLSRPDRPGALVSASSEIAVGCLAAAMDLDLAIPADLAFATFDGFPHADVFHPRVTTVEQPGYHVGATAMRLLLDRLDGDDSVPRTVRLQPQVTYRTSCGCAPGTPGGGPPPPRPRRKEQDPGRGGAA